MAMNNPYPQPMLGGAPQMPGATGPAGMVPGQGAMNAPVGGTAYQQGTGFPGAGATGPADAFNPLSDPTAAVYRGLLNRGINPDFPTMGVSALLKKADDIVRQLAVRLGAGGQADVLTGPGFQDAVNALISRATTGAGGGVLSGPTEGRALADQLNQIVNSARGGTGGEGAQYLADILADSPKTAVGFLDSLLYGNRAPSVRSALSRPLAGQAIRLGQYAEQPGNVPDVTQRSALDILLSGILNTGAAPPPGVPRTSGLGAPTGQALPLQQQLGPPGY